MDVYFGDESGKIIEAKDAAIMRFLLEAGLHLEGEAKEELERHPRRIDTGNLRNSIANQVVQDESAVYVGTNVEYGIYVHEGTRRMEANRFLRNAFMRNEKQLEDRLRDAMNGER